MKKYVFLLFLCLFSFSYAKESQIKLSDIDFGNAIGSPKKIKALIEFLSQKHLPPLSEKDKKTAEGVIELFKKATKEYLGTNNLISFCILNDIYDRKKFRHYEMENTYFAFDPNTNMNRARQIISMLFPVDADDWFDGYSALEAIPRLSFFALKIIKKTNDRIIGRFDFDIWGAGFTRGKCIFSALKNKDKWVIQELRIAKRGSDKLEDGLLVYSRDKEKHKNTAK